MKPFLLLLFTTFTLPASAGTAAGQSSALQGAQAGPPFDAGRWEIQSISGAYFSLSSDSIEDTGMNSSLSSYRIGLMLNNSSGTGWFRGNSEMLAEGFFGSVFEGPGDFFGGTTLLLRCNFVQQECRWVPYVQGGAGAFYSDIQKNHRQSLIGSAWEINLQAAAGMRYFLNEKWSLNLEGGYRRVTPTRSSERNDGLDALGFQIGLSRFF